MSASRPTVLVIDDDRDILDLIEIVLKQEGYEVQLAHNGQTALAMYAQHKAALILLDMRMPVMDGWAFEKEFRRRHDNETPIVVMSAAESAAQRAEQVGAENYLGKPFDLSELKAVVAQYVLRGDDSTAG